MVDSKFEEFKIVVVQEVISQKSVQQSESSEVGKDCLRRNRVNLSSAQ